MAWRTISDGSPLSVQAAPLRTAKRITPGSPVAPGRALFIACSMAGMVTIKLASGDTLEIPLEVGANMIEGIAVVDVVASGTTAQCVVSVLS